MRTDYEAFFLLQNLMLVAQAMGLGGWIHPSVFAPYVLQRDPAKQWFGLGFRMQVPDKPWVRWPPVPATQPNPVGIDGVLEGLCPPYVGSMNEAVDVVVAEKYGPKGMYGDAAGFALPYKNAADAQEYLRLEAPFSAQAIEYTKEICTYLFDTYGRFPAHVDAFYVPGIWLQVSHLELEYYARFFKSALVERQAAHGKTWGEE